MSDYKSLVKLHLAAIDGALPPRGFSKELGQEPLLTVLESIPPHAPLSSYRADLPHPPTSAGSAIEVWYKDRIEACSQVSIENSIELSKYAFPQDVNLIHQLQDLRRRVYAEHLQPYDGSLADWASLSDQDVIKTYTKGVEPDAMVDILRIYVLPHFRVHHSQGEDFVALISWMESLDLEILLPLIQNSMSTMSNQERRIIKDDRTVCLIVLSALYSSSSSDWEVMSALYECLPTFFTKPSNMDNQKHSADDLLTFSQTKPARVTLTNKFVSDEKLSKALDRLDSHLESCEIFSCWSVPLPLYQVGYLAEIGSAEEQLEFARRLARRYASAGQDQATQCQRVKVDMTKLAAEEGALCRLSSEQIGTLILEAVMSRGEFDLAKKLAATEMLPDALVRKIALDSSNEYLYNATGIRGSDVRSALECLRVPAQHSELEIQRAKIQGLIKLSAYDTGCDLTPMILKLHSNPVQLLYQVLQLNSGLYKDSKSVLALASSLGVTDKTVVWACLTEFSVSLNDPSTSHAAAKSSDKWDALLLASSIGDIGARKELIRLSLSKCPAYEMKSVLEAWHNLSENAEITEQVAPSTPTFPQISLSSVSVSPLQLGLNAVRAARTLERVAQAGLSSLSAPRSSSIGRMMAANDMRRTASGTGWRGWLLGDDAPDKPAD